MSSTITAETIIDGNTTTKIEYFYDPYGAYGFSIDGTFYYYVKNLQGDVTQIRDTSNNLKASYIYDAWGKVLSITENTTNNIGTKNAIRYRGYYYDTESNLYYLNARYYDPQIKRFLNPDGILGANGGLVGYNMYAYCNNDPVAFKDQNGYKMVALPVEGYKVKEKSVWEKIKDVANNTFGAGLSATTTISEYETPLIPDPFPITIISGDKTTQTVSECGDSSKPIYVYANEDVKNPFKSSSAGIKINIFAISLDVSIGMDDIGVSGSITNEDKTHSLGLRINLSKFKVGFEGSTAIQQGNTTETIYTNGSISGWWIIAAVVFCKTGQLMRSPSYEY